MQYARARKNNDAETALAIATNPIVTKTKNDPTLTKFESDCDQKNAKYFKLIRSNLFPLLH
jgi:hypothetical protein